MGRPNIGPITTGQFCIVFCLGMVLHAMTVNEGQSPFHQMQQSSEGPWASECLWAKAGIWRCKKGQNVLLDPGRFQCNWMKQCFAPFVERFTETILEIMPRALIGVCPPAFGKESNEAFPSPLHPQAFWSPHFYDGIVLLGKVWTPGFGIEETPGEKLFNLFPTPVRPVLDLKKRVESYKRQLQRKCDFAAQPVPNIVGEIGLPFELQYVGFPDFGGKGRDAVDEAADAHMRALEEIMLPHCWWNYTPENCQERGDFWNGENLSIFANEEGRAPKSLIRPYLLRCSGVPISQSFYLQEGIYRCEFQVQKPGETLFFIPSIHYPLGQTKILATPGVEASVSQSSLVCRNYQYSGRVVIELRREE